MLVLTGSTCRDPVYSKQCREIADDVNSRIDAIADRYGDCEVNSDCTYAAIVVPCSRDILRNSVIAYADYSSVQDQIKQLAEDKCSVSTINDCNSMCGTTGNYIFPITGAACVDNHCEAKQLSHEKDAYI